MPKIPSELDVTALELSLLTMWKESGVVDKVYKYKQHIKALNPHNRVNTELFYDLTNGRLFKDLVDIASVADSCPEDYAVDLQVLLASRFVSDMKLKTIEDDNTDFSKVCLKDVGDTGRNTPHCSQHGAMNKVSMFEDGGGYWRCSSSNKEFGNCRAGCIEYK